MLKNKWINLLLILIALLFLGACSNNKIENRLDWKVEDFQAVNQDGQPVTLDDLNGKVWIADFIFTNCKTVCPLLTTNMIRLQQKLKDQNLDVQIISFSVDPERDTPEHLKEYSNKYSAELSNWDFLTGYSFEDIKTLSYNSFKALIQKTPDSDQISHGTRFYLIDKDGKIAKYYHGNTNVPFDQILKDTKTLLQ